MYVPYVFLWFLKTGKCLGQCGLVFFRSRNWWFFMPEQLTNTGAVTTTLNSENWKTGSLQFCLYEYWSDKHWISEWSNSFSPERPRALVTSVAEGELRVHVFPTTAALTFPTLLSPFYLYYIFPTLLSPFYLYYILTISLLHLKLVTSHSHLLSGLRNLEYNPTHPQICRH